MFLEEIRQQFPQVSPHDLLFRNLSLHGFWLIDWLRNAARSEVTETYRKFADLVVDGSLSVAVQACNEAQAADTKGSNIVPTA